MKPELLRFGITRVAQQTGLDTTGIPCFAAIRPNSRTLAVHQGKGPDDASAEVSAIMEAAEYAVAEGPTAERIIASTIEMDSDGREVFIPAGALPRNYRLAPASELAWLEGFRLSDRSSIFVPLDAVALVPRSDASPPFNQSTNGLGAGFDEDTATAHGFWELIERDASTLWSMRTRARCAGSALSIRAVADAALPSAKRIIDAGFQFRAFDLTTDLGVPVVMALLWSGTPRNYFDVASGVCAHPSASRALSGALEEAAQTRVSNIAGARDDIEPEEYGLALPEWMVDVMTASEGSDRPLPRSLSDGEVGTLIDRIPGNTVAFALSRKDDPIKVVKVMSDFLEDRSTNVHWRPGPRAIGAMMAP